MGEAEKDKKRRGFLSKRQKSIIYMLLQMNAEPITVAAISEKLGVSSRTILRELPAIEQWLSDNDFVFSRKPGIGLLIDEKQENRQLIEELLSAEDVIPLFGKKERSRQILGNLLFASEPIKTYVFTSHFNISEKTLLGDLDVLEDWLAEYQIRIIRRTGLGIFLEGSEINIRQAITNAVFEFCDIDRLSALITGEDSYGQREMQMKQSLTSFLEDDIMIFTKKLIKDCERQLKIRCVDSSRLRLTLRIALAIYRMKLGKYLDDASVNHEKIKTLEEYSVAKYIAKKITKEFSLDVTQVEEDYIVMHFSTTRIWSDASDFKDPIQMLGVRQVVMSMAGIAGQITSIPFYNDRVFLEDLSAHIVAMKKRKLLNVITENTETDVVKTNYPEIYDAVVVASEVLRDWISPSPLRSSDIGYIAMHFAVAAERFQEQKQKIVVALVCPAGIASSRMLSVALRKSFPNIIVRKSVSAFEVNELELKNEGIDFLISTVKLKTDFPYICVEKMLQLQDKARIQNTIEQINKERLQEQISNGDAYSTHMTIDDIQKRTIVGTEIIELVNHFSIHNMQKAENREEILTKGASIIEDDPEKTEKLINGFRQREAISDGYIKEMQIYLFHCETDAVEHSRFSYLSLEEPLQTEKGLVEGAVVMAVPKFEGVTFHKEPIGRLSALLVEQPGFLQVLKQSDTIAGLAFVKQALVKYYQQNNLK